MIGALEHIFPRKVRTLDDMCGALKGVDDLETLFVVFEDATGVCLMPLEVNGREPTSERINWMLDRAKLLLHRAVEDRA